MGIFIVIVAIAINLFMIKTTEDQIVSSYDGTSGSVSNETLVEISRIEPECIMVLGASVHPDGTPSPMLEDRLETGIELYNRGVAPKLLLTGDNGQIEYNEVEAMKNYAVNAGVPEEDIFLDHAGFSTYDSVYRASYVFGVESMVAVTQEYREIREGLARVKDFVMWLIKPEATFLGEAIPISGSGIVTQ